MIPVSFDYLSPASLDEATGALARPGSVVVAGGQGLIPAMTTGGSAPALLVDVRRIAALRGVSRVSGSGALRVGAMTTLAAIAESAEIAGGISALAEAAAAAGDPQVRHRATIGGAIVDAHPAGDLVAAVLALDAVVNVAGPTGTRSIPAADFVVGPRVTSLQRGEIVTSIEVPPPGARAGSAYVKQRHPGSGYALCGVATAVTLREDGSIGGCRVGLTGATGWPERVEAAEAAAAGRDPATGAAAAAAALGAAALAYRTDQGASAEYRAHLARVLTERAILLAATRAG